MIYSLSVEINAEDYDIKRVKNGMKNCEGCPFRSGDLRKVIDMRGYNCHLEFIYLFKEACNIIKVIKKGGSK